MAKRKDIPQVQRVQLKPLFGMKPGVWLSILYLAVLVLALFLFGILPDLKNAFMRVSFSSKALSTAVYIDGNYAGGTPFSVNVQSGEHRVEFRVDENVLDTVDIKVKHPVFFNWLFPRKMNVVSNETMPQNVLHDVGRTFLNDTARYSAVTEYDSTFVYPPLFENYARILIANGAAANTAMQSYLYDAAQFISTQAMLTDAQKAFELLGLAHDFSKTEAIVNNTARKAAGIEPSVTDYKADTLQAKDGSFALEGLLINGAYSMACETVNEKLWSQFAEETHFNSDDLYYLSGVGSSSVKPVRNISYRSAQAFCAWLSEKTGRNVFIPSEEQWRTAFALSDGQFGKTLVSSTVNQDKKGVLKTMAGGLWEFTSTCYVPYEAFYGSTGIQNRLAELDIDADIIIKGGSYITSPDSVTSETDGLIPKNFCSDYTGLRPAWV